MADLIFTIGEAAWSTCDVSGKEEGGKEEGGKEEGGREVGTFQENHYPQLRFLISRILRFQDQHVMFQVRRGTFQENHSSGTKPVEP